MAASAQTERLPIVSPQQAAAAALAPGAEVTVFGGADVPLSLAGEPYMPDGQPLPVATDATLLRRCVSR